MLRSGTGPGYLAWIKNDDLEKNKWPASTLVDGVKRNKESEGGHRHEAAARLSIRSRTNPLDADHQNAPQEIHAS